jgi:uncharacterized protein (TIGR00297 family)
MTPALAAAIAAPIALAAWLARTLDRGGALAAWGVGTAVLAAAGGVGGGVLLTFFISASALSRIPPAGPATLDPRGNRRDARQVLANGGAAAVAGLLVLAGLLPAVAGLWISTASLAAAAADTWATAIGGASRLAPRDLFSGKPVPPGTSGGVTRRGTLGALGGAFVVSLPAACSGHSAVLAAGTIIGLGGMLLDSALGATVQARFRCPRCATRSEWPQHRCGTRTRHEGGWRWLTNDGVNAIATGTAALAGWAAWLCCSLAS